ncbi:MAG: xylose isomerase, partial [Rhizobiaceae bacterium]
KMLAYYEILKAGGLATGGPNFDAKLRRQSLDPEDLILAHVGGMDVCARALKAAAAMLEDGSLERLREDRYADWNSTDAQEMLASAALELCEERVLSQGIEPEPRSGKQERLENLVNRFI